MRFRQQLNGLIYAIPNKHSKPVSRRIAVEEEESGAIKTYVMNLKGNIGQQAIPSQADTLAKAQNLASKMELHIRKKEGARRPAITLASRKPNEAEIRFG
jgi:hypothetical protein